MSLPPRRLEPYSAAVIEFRKSSYCGGGNCVEVGFAVSSHCTNDGCVEVGFVKSSHSGAAGHCVEVDRTSAAPEVLVRDTKDRSIPPMRYTADEWEAFVAGVKDGEFDL